MNVGFLVTIISTLQLVIPTSKNEWNSISCPVSSQRRLIEHQFCQNLDEYICLTDTNSNQSKNFCEKVENLKINFAPLGNKLVWTGGFRNKDCVENRYQPFKLYPNESEKCVYLKSSCTEEGQYVHKNNSAVFDRSCGCNSTAGYELINKNIDNCKPTEMDCTCIRTGKGTYEVYTESQKASFTSLGSQKYNYLPQETAEGLKAKEIYRITAKICALTGLIMVLCGTVIVAFMSFESEDTKMKTDCYCNEPDIATKAPVVQEDTRSRDCNMHSVEVQSDSSCTIPFGQELTTTIQTINEMQNQSSTTGIESTLINYGSNMQQSDISSRDDNNLSQSEEILDNEPSDCNCVEPDIATRAPVEQEDTRSRDCNMHSVEVQSALSCTIPFEFSTTIQTMNEMQNQSSTTGIESPLIDNDSNMQQSDISSRDDNNLSQSEEILDNEPSDLNLELASGEYCQKEQCEEMNKSSSYVVVGIDIGSTYTKVAICVTDSVNGYCHCLPKGIKVVTEPTIIIIDKKNTAEAFGNKAQLMLKDTYGTYNNLPYFENFRTELCQREEALECCKIGQDPLFAKYVICGIITKIKNKVLKIVDKKREKAIESNIKWVLTIPVEWHMKEKEFILNCCEMGGLQKGSVLLITETLAISMFYRVELADINSPFFVIDIGGDTCTFSVKQKVDNLIELCSFRSKLGGKRFEMEMLAILENMLGDKVFDLMEPQDKRVLLEQLEKLKIDFSKEPNDKKLKINSILLEYRCNKFYNKSLQQSIDDSAYCETIQLEIKDDKGVLSKEDTLFIKETVIEQVIKKVTQDIIDKIKDFMKNHSEISTVLVVGGFAESLEVEYAIRKTLGRPNIKVIYDKNLQDVIAKGAVSFGLQNIISK